MAIKIDVLLKLFRAQSEVMRDPESIKYWRGVHEEARDDSVEQFFRAFNSFKLRKPLGLIPIKKPTRKELGRQALGKLREKRFRTKGFSGVSSVYGIGRAFKFGVGRIVGGFK